MASAPSSPSPIPSSVILAASAAASSSPAAAPIPPPATSIPFAYLAIIPENITPSGHKVRKMIITDGPDRHKIVWYKECNPKDYPPLLAKLESAISASYRAVRLRNFARIRPVVDAEGIVKGTISYDMSDFSPLKRTILKIEELVQYGIADELVSRYHREEDDEQPDNVGYVEGQGIVGIDCGMSYFSLTSRFQGERFINGTIAPSAANAFPQTSDDVRKFPDVTDAQPCHWPTRSPTNLNWSRAFTNSADFKRLNESKDFVHKSHAAFLRELLLLSDPLSQLFRNNFTMSEEDQAVCRDLCALAEKRKAKLEEILIADDAFRKFLLESKGIFKESVDHFTEYNRLIGPEENIVFDLPAVEKVLESLLKKCLIKDLTKSFFELGSRIDKLQRTKSLHNSYQQFLVACIEFKGSHHSLQTCIESLHQQITDLIGSCSDGKGELWNILLEDIKELIMKYRKATERLLKKEVDPVGSQLMSAEEFRERKESQDIEQHLATAVLEWLAQPIHKNKVIAFVEETLQEYRPTGTGSYFEMLNPKHYTKTRGAELEGLIVQLKDPQLPNALNPVINFFRSGNWNEGWCFSLIHFVDVSANVRLINKICLAAIEHIRRDLSLEQLMNFDMVKICFKIDRLEWKPLLVGQKVLAIASVKQTQAAASPGVSRPPERS